MLFPSLVWLGLFLGVEQTALWRTPFAQPGLTADATAVIAVGSRTTARIVYLQPLQHGGYGPAVQIGVSVKVF